jgi:hypothetical protein
MTNFTLNQQDTNQLKHCISDLLRKLDYLRLLLLEYLI